MLGYGGWDGAVGPGDAAEPDLRDLDERFADWEHLMAVEELAGMLGREFGPARNWPWTWARRPDLAECVLDAVFAIQARHADVERLLLRWRAWRAASGANATGAVGLAEVLADGEGPRIPDDPTGRERLVLPRNRVAGRRKAEVAGDAAVSLAGQGIDGLDDFHALLGQRPQVAMLAWESVHGLGETSWCHLRLLAGSGVVAPGRRLRRLLGDGKAVPAAEAVDLVRGVAGALGVAPVAAEYALSLVACRARPKPTEGDADVARAA